MNELKNNTVVDILQERMKREKAQSEDSMSFQSQMSGVSREQETLLLENLAKNAQGIVRTIEDKVQKIQADNSISLHNFFLIRPIILPGII